MHHADQWSHRAVLGPRVSLRVTLRISLLVSAPATVNLVLHELQKGGEFTRSLVWKRPVSFIEQYFFKGAPGTSTLEFVVGKQLFFFSASHCFCGKFYPCTLSLNVDSEFRLQEKNQNTCLHVARSHHVRGDTLLIERALASSAMD